MSMLAQRTVHWELLFAQGVVGQLLQVLVAMRFRKTTDDPQGWYRVAVRKKAAVKACSALHPTDSTPASVTPSTMYDARCTGGSFGHGTHQQQCQHWALE